MCGIGQKRFQKDGDDRIIETEMNRPDLFYELCNPIIHELIDFKSFHSRLKEPAFGNKHSDRVLP